jgi:hypothetical protein
VGSTARTGGGAGGRPGFAGMGGAVTGFAASGGISGFGCQNFSDCVTSASPPLSWDIGRLCEVEVKPA